MTVTIPTELETALQHEAEQRQLSVENVVQEALAWYLQMDTGLLDELAAWQEVRDEAAKSSKELHLESRRYLLGRFAGSRRTRAARTATGDYLARYLGICSTTYRSDHSAHVPFGRTAFSGHLACRSDTHEWT